jgi:hypothetical protein
MTGVVPACDEAMAGDDVFGLLFENGRHCSDLVRDMMAEQDGNSQVRPLSQWHAAFPIHQT